MDGIINSKHVVQRYTERHGISIEDLGVAPTVVVSWGRSLTKSLADQAGAKLCESWLWHDKHKLYKGTIHGEPVSFANVPVGAPATIMVMEEMIASGGMAFIGLGVAGSLQPQAPIGTAVIPTHCISEEGTSKHYLDPNQEISCSDRLAKILEEACKKQELPVLKGLHWTMDAVYRETEEKVRAYRERDVLSVDMETSAMYALGLYRGVEVCNLLPISDELWSDYWKLPFEAKYSEKASQAKEKAMRAILTCLEEAARNRY